MKTSNSKTKAFAFLGAAFVLLIALMFTACPNAAKAPEPAPAPPAPEYTPVAYGKLAEYLQNLPAGDTVHKIEVTGLAKEHLNGNGGDTLAQTLKAHPAKKVALKLPKTVEGLTDMTACFNGCTNLVSVLALPDGVTNMQNCFLGCSSLKQAPAIPAGVTDMRYCFNGCSSLTKAPAIPDGVQNMLSCFEGCGSLTEAPAIPSGVTNMVDCFKGCASLVEAPPLPATVKAILGCFRDCGSLKKAPSAIPDGVTDVAECFWGCGSLEKPPAIPEGVTSMENCFNGCGSLTEAPEIPASVLYPHDCFNGCGKLTSVTLKCNYRDGAFYDLFKGCSGLKAGSIKVPENQLQEYKNHADTMGTSSKKFAAIVPYGTNGANLDSYLSSASSSDVNYIALTGIPAGDLKGDGFNPSKLARILKNHSDKKVALELPKEVAGLTSMSQCFWNCTNLVSVVNIPQGVTSIADCFNGCTNLKTAPTIPASVEDMNSCFKNCKALTQAPVIPASVKIMVDCFWGCEALTSVTLKCNYSFSFANAFAFCNALGEKSIKVPQAYYSRYTDADALNNMEVPGNSEEEKREKFEGVAELNP